MFSPFGVSTAFFGPRTCKVSKLVDDRWSQFLNFAISHGARLNGEWLLKYSFLLQGSVSNFPQSKYHVPPGRTAIPTTNVRATSDTHIPSTVTDSGCQYRPR